MRHTLANLNPEQRDAVTTVDRPLLVLAGAGSGKTGVITHKIAWLVGSDVCAADSVVAVTFTNKAAAEMKARVARMLPKSDSRKLRVSTFHRLGLRLLHRHAASRHNTAPFTGSSDEDAMLLGNLRPGFSLFDASDSRSVIAEILGDGHLNGEDKAAAASISNWKNELVSPTDALKTADDRLSRHHATVYQRYQQFLMSCNALDFDDLIRLPVEILRRDAAMREKIQGNLQQLLVDEYQDTNRCQYELVKLLVGDSAVLTAVGDDDQSIYSWRGANPENLNALTRDFPSLKVVKLEQNYRSSQRILRSANSVIAENPHVFEKRLWSDLGVGEPLRLSVCRDSRDEAEWIAADILTQKFRHNVRSRDIAILYRSNYQSRPIEQALRERGLRYEISGGKSYFDFSEVKDLMAYLRLMTNSSDDNAFLRVVNRPKRAIGPRTLERLGGFAAEKKCSLFDACLDPSLSSVLPGKPGIRLQDFANRIVLQADNAMRGDPVEAIREFLQMIDFDAWIEDQSASEKATERARENIVEMLDWMQRLANEGDDESNATARDFKSMVAHVSLVDMLSRQSTTNDSNSHQEGMDESAVQLMTMHAAKGLEFPHVYIAGMEEGTLPHQNSTEDEQLQEERRLAYVGITRARFRLTFTMASTRSRFGEVKTAEVSRFLDAIAPEDLERLGVDASTESLERNMATGKSTLESLKAMLDDAGA